MEFDNTVVTILRHFDKFLNFYCISGTANVAPYCAVSLAHDDPWWLVDLTAEKVITRVVLQTRTDCCCERHLQLNRL